MTATTPKGSARPHNVDRGSVRHGASAPTTVQEAEQQAKARMAEMGAGTEPMTAFLIEAAEVETRLRQHILELIEPSMRKQNILENRLREVNAYIGSTQDEVQDLKKLSSGAEGLYTMVENFRVELSGWDKERHEHEQKVGDRLSMQEIEINALRQSLEVLKGADHGTISRSLKNFGDMLAAYKEENTDLRRFCVERIDLNRDKLSKLRDEFETRTMILENQMHHLQDMQTTTNTKLTHVEDIVARMDQRVDAGANGIADLWRSKASVACVEEQQSDLTEFMRHVNSVVSSLKQQFGSLVDDVKAHFETATKIVGQSTAKQMDSMRSQYEEDVQRIDNVRREIEEFVQVQSQAHQQLEQNLVKLRQTIFFGSDAVDESGPAQLSEAPPKGSETPDVESEAPEEHRTSPDCTWGINQLHRALEKLEKNRDLDAKNLQVDFAQFRRSLHQHEAQLTDRGSTISYHNSVVSTLVESALMGLSLELQDDQDRKSIALFGIKGGHEKGSSLALPDITPKQSRMTSGPSAAVRAPTVTPRRRLTQKSPELAPVAATPPVPALDSGPEAVLSLDQRCLSCSGSAATVLGGFKMACLQYAPSPVEWERSSYSRSDLIHKRMQLLQQAKVLLSCRSLD